MRGVGGGAGRTCAGPGGARAGGAYLLEVEESGRAGHGVREHAAGVGQQEAARVRHGAQHGAAGGRPAAEAALRSLRPSVCARALPPGRPPGLSSSGPPLPRVALVKREAWKGERRASAGGCPCPGGEAGESARQTMERGWMRCARGWMWAEGSQSLWSHRSPVCKEWCVCVCECARVRACVAVGGGVPGVLQHQTEPRALARGKRTRPTAPLPVPHLTPRPPACAGPPVLAPSRGPCAPLLRPRAASSPGGDRVWDLRWPLLV